jgi:hypothetical protein
MIPNLLVEMPTHIDALREAVKAVAKAETEAEFVVHLEALNKLKERLRIDTDFSSKKVRSASKLCETLSVSVDRGQSLRVIHAILSVYKRLFIWRPAPPPPTSERHVKSDAELDSITKSYLAAREGLRDLIRTSEVELSGVLRNETTPNRMTGPADL